MTTVVDLPAVVDVPDTLPDNDEGKKPPGRFGCHLLDVIRDPGRTSYFTIRPGGQAVGVMTLCGSPDTASGVPLEDHPNCLGPKCDGPGGCQRTRCPACTAAWMDRQLKK